MSTELDALGRDPSVAESAAGHPPERRAAALARHRRSASSRRPWRARSRSSSTSRPEPTWRPLSRWGILLVLIGVIVAGGSFAGRDARDPRPRLGAAVSRRGRGRHRAHPDPRRVLAAPQLADAGGAARRRDRPATARAVRDGGGAEAGAARYRAAARLRSGSRTCAAAEDLLGREEAHVARMDQLARPARRVGRQGAARDARRPQRDAAAHEIDLKTSALEHLGPIAKEPRARERLEVEVRDQESRPRAGPRRRGERPRPGRAEHGRRRAGRGRGRAPRRLARAAGRRSASPSRAGDDPAAPSSAPRSRR